MKPLTDLDHYEVLEIPRSTPPEGVERAYHLAMATYADDSLAGYSVFDPGDAAAMRERIETAYRVLSNLEARGLYDAECGAHAEREFEEAPQQAEFVESEPIERLAVELPTELEPAEIQQVEAFDEDSDEYDGARLRRARMRRGLEIEDVARVTKVNPTYLKFIEEDRFGDLPARVYVRGFLMAYSSCVGLDPNAAAQSYLARFDSVVAQVTLRSRGA